MWGKWYTAWGVPDDTEMYIQESGRAGRDGKLALALIMQKNWTIIAQIQTLVENQFCLSPSKKNLVAIIRCNADEEVNWFKSLFFTYECVQYEYKSSTLYLT